MNWKQIWQGALASVLTVSLLAACSGGGDSSSATTITTPAVAAATMRVHYHRTQADTAGWGVYAWNGPVTTAAKWPDDRVQFNKTDSFGAWVDIPLNTAAKTLDFLVIDGSGTKNCQTDQHASFNSNIATQGQEIWMLQGDCQVYAQQPAVPLGNLAQAGAMWLDATTLAWPSAPASASYQLYHAANGGMTVDSTGVHGADGNVALTANGTVSGANATAHPQLTGATTLTLANVDTATLKTWLKGELVVAQLDGTGKLVQATSVQTAWVLDTLYADNAANQPLGLTFAGDGTPTFSLWAPTAQSVQLNVSPTTGAAVAVAMTQDTNTGIWRYTGQAAWTSQAYYSFDVKVFSRAAGNVMVTNTVTDPYSLSLNANGAQSFVANLDDASLKPTGWDAHAIPALASNADISLYETHVRDFSANDSTVPAAHRGKYLAFTDAGSNGMQHLKALQQVGLTHIHLMPVFDISSVNETGCSTPTIPNAAADSDQQQTAVAATKDADCFNWGYDPLHYTAPEGSYATDAADGSVRVKEFRQMVAALHGAGLRVVLDVVYNHTAAAGQDPNSVLDKVVPGYYYRLDGQGNIWTSTCCSNTATENRMMARLMIDSAKTWATAYKVDGFRFDIMGHIPLAAIESLRTQTDAAAGRALYYYGEGWNFGEVANDAYFKQARQANLTGTGIGSFNDRLRDAVRGGGCCDSGQTLVSQQGFANGLYLAPNGSSTQTKDDLLHLADLVRVGLTGTLASYTFTDKDGNTKQNSQIDYSGQAAGYTANPAEIINYIEAHDNQTLFDINALKLPANTTADERVRAQNLGAGILLLSQGIPFIHAGQDILRSKSLDRNSYNSGDWFNKIDWGYQANNFGVGLPMQSDNGGDWSVIKPFLTNGTLSMGNTQIANARDVFRDFLAIRQSSTLFRLRTGADVKQRLAFYNTGTTQVPGVVVERIDGAGYTGANYGSVVVAINADVNAQTLSIPALAGTTYTLHARQQTGADARVKTATLTAGSLSIPARSVAVFVAP
ncbi:pullulanase-type alpha-1,6-glucosidase [Andreprevotia chitinilytica]|uniref:pullulanase-type alpha-1,6-glucosidase n=1 Tax=Andreprevotia chitinilytica TaxID=396808 RepID=UPI00068C383F|nr:pullulanase-type alpha-1,6-glucosidase [Andreprevotia chitinilytica]